MRKQALIVTLPLFFALVVSLSPVATPQSALASIKWTKVPIVEVDGCRFDIGTASDPLLDTVANRPTDLFVYVPRDVLRTARVIEVDSGWNNLGYDIRFIQDTNLTYSASHIQVRVVGRAYALSQYSTLPFSVATSWLTDGCTRVIEAQADGFVNQNVTLNAY